MALDVALKFYEMYNTHNVDLLDSLLTSSYVGHVNGQDLNGLAAAKTMIGGFLKAFPDVQYTVEDTLVSGESVVARWTATATHAGQFAGLEPTNRTVKMNGITIFQTQDGQIGELWNSWDVFGLMQQLRAS